MLKLIVRQQFSLQGGKLYMPGDSVASEDLHAVQSTPDIAKLCVISIHEDPADAPPPDSAMTPGDDTSIAAPAKRK